MLGSTGPHTGFLMMDKAQSPTVVFSGVPSWVIQTTDYLWPASVSVSGQSAMRHAAKLKDPSATKTRVYSTSILSVLLCGSEMSPLSTSDAKAWLDLTAEDSVEI